MGRRRPFRLPCPFVIGPVAIATAAALLLAPGPAAADPDPAPAISLNPTVADLRVQVDDLYRQAELARSDTTPRTSGPRRRRHACRRYTRN